MIREYDVKKNITTHGDTATLFLGIKAENVPVKDAIDTESEFTRFLSRVTNGQITTTAKPSDTRNIPWTPAEIAVVESATSIEDVKAKYREAFPESLRSNDAVKHKYLDLNGKAVKTGTSAALSSTVAEKVAHKEAEAAKVGAAVHAEQQGDRKDRKVKEEAPAAPPPAEKLTKADRKTANAENAKADRWTDEEKTLIREHLKDDTPAEAWSAYQKKFPKSTRNQNAVYQRWHKMRNQKVPATGKPRKTAGKLPYKLRNVAPPTQPAPEEEPVTTRYAGDEQQDPADAPLDPPQQPDELETYEVKGLDQDLADAMPDERPPTGKKEKQEAARTIETLKIGDRVRQVGGLRICRGEGEVIRAAPGSPEILVRFENGQEWINRKNLAPVSA